MDDKNVDGFIMKGGEFIALDDVEGMFKSAKASLETPREIAQMMIDLAKECDAKGRYVPAHAYFQKALDLSDTCPMKAFCLLALGQMKEKQEDIAGAMEWYLKAFLMEPGGDDNWYLLHNNLGYCMNQLGRHAEAAELCRKAIRIDAGRHNAHKNLGLALEGLGRYADAAASYITAAENCQVDPRAFLHLEALLRSHPEIEKEIQDLRIRIGACRGNAGAIWN